jgi:Domain of unknown function DUF29
MMLQAPLRRVFVATRVQAPVRTDPDYDRDLYAWSKAQADLLRARRFDEVDLEHLIEEIEDVGAALGRSVRNRTITIIEHLLKLQHAPATDPRPGWRQTVRTQRVKLRRALTPTLSRELEAELPALYADARDLAAGAFTDHGETAAARQLPDACPYDLDRITGNWLPDRVSI